MATKEDTAGLSSPNQSVATVAALDRAEVLEAYVLEPRDYDRSAVQRTTESGTNVSEPDRSSTSESLEENNTHVRDAEADDSRTPFSDSENKSMLEEPEGQHTEATGESVSETGSGQSMASGSERTGSDPEVDVTVYDKTAEAKAAYDQLLAESRRKSEELREKGLCYPVVGISCFARRRSHNQ